ncbi:replication initiator protein [Microvirus mar61]|uniref:Replication initiator protein n=1 Tax=Microvirus mar61 TaxID=2851198 RepID=A0A8F5RC50_9VIRU|nr:replication initiator protein [Microvirus mar61]
MHRCMCQYSRNIRIPGTRHLIRVDCGHCSSCLQKKANKRAYRFRNHKPEGFTPYFVTLTYNNKSLPYIKRHDTRNLIFKSNSDGSITSEYRLDNKQNVSFVPVYRNMRIARGRRCSFIVNGQTQIGEHPVPITTSSPFNNVTPPRYEISKGKGLAYRHGDIGIYYPRDVQNFLKRLRTNLARKAKVSVPISFYSSPEYGPTTMRPHMHLCIWVPTFVSREDFESAVVKSWPFASSARTRKFIQIAKNVGKYLAQYVNCGSNIPLSLQRWFPLRPTHSLHFGFDHDMFSFDSVFGFLTIGHTAQYVEFRYVKYEGFVPYSKIFPSYVVRAYYLACKGFSRLSRPTLYGLYRYPQKLHQKLTCYKFKVLADGQLSYARNVFDNGHNPIYMTDKEVEYFINGLESRYTNFQNKGYSWFDYADMVVDSLITYKLSFLAFQYSEQSDSIDEIFYNYDNFADLMNEESKLESDLKQLYYSNSIMPKILQPPEYPRVRELDKYYTSEFHKNIKQRKCSTQEFVCLC